MISPNVLTPNSIGYKSNDNNIKRMAKLINLSGDFIM